MKACWNAVTYSVDHPLDGPSALEQLCNDQVAIVVLKNAVSTEQVEALTQEIYRRRDRAAVSSYSNGSLTTFGPYLVRHLANPSRYFESAESNEELFSTQRIDLRRHVRSRLKDFFGLRSLAIAEESDGRPYAPAVVRIHGDGVGNPLHNDNIMRDAASTGLMLARLASQFSCITCLQECDRDGELLHYRRRWKPEHEVFKVKDGLGYQSEVVNGTEVCCFRPTRGDVYVINPTNYHAIAEVSGRDRVTLGFFFGFFDQELKDAVCWS